jgi:hypothetical protein
VMVMFWLVVFTPFGYNFRCFDDRCVRGAGL